MDVPVPSRIALSGHLAEPVAARLRQTLPRLEVRVVAPGALSEADRAWADAYSGFAPPSDLASSRLTWIHAMSAGVDRFVPALRSADLPVVLTRTVGHMPEKIGTYVLSHLLADAQHHRLYERQQENRQWTPREPRRTDGECVAVLGTGTIGGGIARRLALVGYRAVGVNSSGHAALGFAETHALADAPELLPRCAALVCALPLTERTEGLVDASLLAHLRDALLVNVGRGATLAEDALRKALEARKIRLAVLDVFRQEPPPDDSWMWEDEQVVITPHVAALTDADDVVEDLVRAYEQVAAGRMPEHAVDLGRGY